MIEIVHANADFERNGCVVVVVVDVVVHRFEHLKSKIRFLHEGGPKVSFPGNTVTGTAAVEVDLIVSPFLHQCNPRGRHGW